MSGVSLFLYDHPVSSYAQKTRIVLREKGLQFQRAAPPALGGTVGSQEDFLKANPRGEVPVLVVSGDSLSNDGAQFTIADSRVICEFLEDRFPEKPLLLQISHVATQSVFPYHITSQILVPSSIFSDSWL